MEKILVTGANGFVGRAVCAELARRSISAVAAVRSLAATPAPFFDPGIAAVEVGQIDGATDWAGALEGCTAVIHLAARAHILADSHADPLAAFRQTNVAGTLALARAAARAGVRRFVFVSSIGVNGSLNCVPFTGADVPAPAETYAASKLEAELALQGATAGGAMELVIVRPPLVYGPECPGNFRRLLQLLATGAPLPFGAIAARRSFIGVWNLADVLLLCTSHPDAAGNVFLVSDMEDVALPGLLRGLADGMGRKARLFSVPPKLLAGVAGALGKSGIYDKLCGGMTVDAAEARRVLDWTAPVSLAEGLRRTGRWYAGYA